MKQSNSDLNLNRWNWGAFLLTWIWGLGNNTYIGLSLFPVALVCIIFFLGFPSLYLYPICLLILYSIFLRLLHGLEGDKLAWKNKKWESMTQFRRVQKKWGIGGAAFYLIFFVFLIFVFLSAINLFNDVIKDVNLQVNSLAKDTYQSEVKLAAQNKELQVILGIPIQSVKPLFLPNYEGVSISPSGEVTSVFFVKGHKGKAKILATAVNHEGKWIIIKETAYITEGQKKQIVTIFAIDKSF